ncbi:MAG: hypothetical protein EHM12_08800, partial [Dehalococcoidia bacterium]
MSDTLAESVGADGWAAPVVPRANALKDQIQKLRDAVDQFPTRDIGATPGAELGVSDSHPGKALTARGLVYLAD